MKDNKGGQIDNSKVTLSRTYYDRAISLSYDSGSSRALWQLYLILREIAESSCRKEVEIKSDEGS